MLLGSNSATFWMPEAASTFAADTDGLFYFIYWVSLFFFALIVGAMCWFAWKYRYIEGTVEKTSPIRGNHKLEIFWSAIPTLLLLFVFAWGFKGYMHSAVPPDNAMNIRVIGMKWSWSLTHPNGGTDGNRLVVPVNTPIRLTMSSEDVLHSFYVPAFRIKRDVLPDRYTVQWFESEQLGTHHIFCTEYCGTGHSSMIGTVEVVSREDYDAYVATLAGCGDGESLAECGERYYTRSGCNACHSVDGSRLVGPSWLGIAGSPRPGSDSGVADENYLRQSIYEPNTYIVEGYQANQMPTYAGRMDEDELNALIAYIQSLGE